MATEKEQEIHIKDNRLFNSDGSLRPGVTLEEAPTPKPEPKPAPQSEQQTQPPRPMRTEGATFGAAAGARPSAAPAEDATGYRGENKIDFHTFILSLASSVQISLGLVAHPMTGQVEQDLAHAQQTIDILGMLETKTVGNLTPEESGLLKQVLFQLRMAYVEMKKRL